MQRDTNINQVWYQTYVTQTSINQTITNRIKKVIIKISAFLFRQVLQMYWKQWKLFHQVSDLQLLGNGTKKVKLTDFHSYQKKSFVFSKYQFYIIFIEQYRASSYVIPKTNTSNLQYKDLYWDSVNKKVCFLIFQSRAVFSNGQKLRPP